MIEVDLKAGDIFTWQNYPLSMDKSKERRWFLYLGNNSIEAIIYQVTTTTQYQYYTNDGVRKITTILSFLPEWEGWKKNLYWICHFLKIDRHIQEIIKKDIYRNLRNAGFNVK
jgi:hypothetical protein